MEPQVLAGSDSYESVESLPLDHGKSRFVGQPFHMAQLDAQE